MAEERSKEQQFCYSELLNLKRKSKREGPNESTKGRKNERKNKEEALYLLEAVSVERWVKNTGWES